MGGPPDAGIETLKLSWF